VSSPQLSSIDIFKLEMFSRKKKRKASIVCQKKEWEKRTTKSKLVSLRSTSNKAKEKRRR